MTNDSLFSEHGLVENMQTVLLLLAMMAFGVQAVLHRPKAARLLFVGAALFCMTCILREVDFEDLQLPLVIKTLAAGTGRNLIMTTLWVAFLAAALPGWRDLWQVARTLITLKASLAFLVAGALLVLGALFDKQIVNSSHNLKWEELSELSGYAILCLASSSVGCGLRSVRPTTLAIGFRATRVGQRSVPHHR